MSDFLTEMTGQGAVPMLEKTLAFNEARQKMLATNIANLTTPGYKARQLDVAGFQKALREASNRRAERGEPFRLGRSREFEVEASGRLRVMPSEVPEENARFHDGTNASIERQMSQLAETAMTHQVATELLKGYFDRLSHAIRGRAI